MTKKLLLSVIFCAAIMSLFAGSLLIQSDAATSIEKPDEQNYKYLSNPIMLAADSTNIYLVNDDQLLVIKKTNSMQGMLEYTLPDTAENIRHISYADNRLFIFTATTVWYAFTSTSGIGSYTNMNLDMAGCTAYHAALISGNLRIYYAKSNVYGFINTTTTARTTYTDNLVGQEINSITTDGTTMYLSAGTLLNAATNLYSHRIYKQLSSQTAPTLVSNNDPFTNLNSLTYINEKFVFVARNQLHVMDSNPPYTLTQIAIENSHSTMSSQVPTFAYAVSADEIYVIDSFKSSIDKYKLINNSLEFTATILAHRGNNGGFYLHPQAISVIDEYRYLVSDDTGVKLIDTRNASGNQMMTFAQLTTVTEIIYDNWQNIYLYDTDTWYKYELNKDNEITSRGIVNPNTLPNTNILKTDAQGNTVDISSYPEITPLTSNAWSLDRLTGKIYYIDNTEIHSIHSYQISDYISPKDLNHYDWKSTDDLLVYSEIKDTLFMKTKSEAILYKYPHAVGPQIQIKKGEQVTVLQNNASMYNTDGDAVITSEYAYILYEPYGTFYINADTYLESIDYYKDGRVFTDETPENITNAARVLVNNLPIYKYPTATDKSLEVSYINRNYGIVGDTPLYGLIVNRKIIIEDGNQNTFYEILVSATGVPPKNGDTSECIHVGYVSTTYVINSYLSPSRPKFNPNAKIVINNEMIQKGGLQVYASASGPGSEYEGEFLQNNDRVRLVEAYDKSKPYTAIMYYGFDQELPGWVKTEYIVPDGISAWQIVAIIALITSVTVIIYISVWYIRKRSKKSDLL